MGPHTGSLVDGLYKLKLYFSFSQTLFNCVSGGVGVKPQRTFENYVQLWHKRFKHISKERIQTLVSKGILGQLDFSSLGVCINCIKEKRTK